MGLDITAYTGLKKLNAAFDSSGEPIDPDTQEPIENYLKPYANPDFPGREQGLDPKAVYGYEDATHALSMSYGSYNHWREHLAKLAGYPALPVERYGKTEYSHAAACWNGAIGPFSELINFSDCEGVIGPVVAAKLLKDFADFDERAQAGDSRHFYETYARMKAGVELAARDGALDFH